MPRHGDRPGRVHMLRQTSPAVTDGKSIWLSLDSKAYYLPELEKDVVEMRIAGLGVWLGFGVEISRALKT